GADGRLRDGAGRPAGVRAGGPGPRRGVLGGAVRVADQRQGRAGDGVAAVAAVAGAGRAAAERVAGGGGGGVAGAQGGGGGGGGPYEWRISGKGGLEMAWRLWRRWLELGGPRPSEWRVQAAEASRLHKTPGARAAYRRQGVACAQLWELIEPRSRAAD